MEWRIIKYLIVLILFVSINTYACVGTFAHTSVDDTLSDAMHNQALVVIATVTKKCEESEGSIHSSTKNKNGQWMFDGLEKETLCAKNSFTIEVNKSFKGPIPEVTEVYISPYKSSCAVGYFHPTKPIFENGKVKKQRYHYIVGQQYLFILDSNSNSLGYNSIFAGIKLGEVSAHYIKEYTEYNTANKQINQDK